MVHAIGLRLRLPLAATHLAAVFRLAASQSR